MKNKILKLTGFISIGLFITGCSPTYNIQPKYNEKDKSVMIDSLKLKNVVYYNNKSRMPDTKALNSVVYSREYFKLDSECKKFTVFTDKATGTWFFYDSELDDILEYYNNKCEVEKVANINFAICTKNTIFITNGEKTNKEAKEYSMATSTAKKGGYGEKTGINFGNNQECFENMKTHFKNKLEKQ